MFVKLSQIVENTTESNRTRIRGALVGLRTYIHVEIFSERRHRAIRSAVQYFFGEISSFSPLGNSDAQ